MFGVLWSNLNEAYGTLVPSSGLDYGLATIQDWLIQFRFYSLLGFLFGIGFAMQLTRAEQRGVDVRPMFYRRMAALLGIGIVHGMLVWGSDVLTEYALIGFILVMFRRLPPRWLLVAAAANLILVPYVISVSLGHLGIQFGPAPQNDGPVFGHGSFLQIVRQVERDYLYWYRRWPLFVFPSFLSLFLLGLWAVRVDLLKRLIARRTALAWILVAAIAGTLLGGYLVVHLPRWWPLPKSSAILGSPLFYLRPWREVLFGLAERLQVWSNASVYAAALALLVSIPAGAKRLQPLAAVGRMALTTYLTQSLISVALFYHYGLGWYGQVGYRGMFAITAVVFAFQIAYSTWWLRRFRFGPMEWLWRSMAYGRRQPMIRAT